MPSNRKFIGVRVLAYNYENIYKSFLIYPIKVNSGKYLSVHGVLVPSITREYFISNNSIHSTIITQRIEPHQLRPPIYTKNGYLYPYNLIYNILSR